MIVRLFNLQLVLILRIISYLWRYFKGYSIQGILDFSEKLYQDFGEERSLWDSLFAYSCPSHWKLWVSAVELVTRFRFGLPVGNVRLVLWHGYMRIIWLLLYQKGMISSIHSFRSGICIILGGISPPPPFFFLQLISKRRLSSLTSGVYTFSHTLRCQLNHLFMSYEVCTCNSLYT